MNTNERLHKLYKFYWNSLIQNGKAIKNPEPANPLLLCINEESYLNSEIKVVIFGQETKCWGKFGDDIKLTQDLYWDFFILEKFFSGYNRSSFWKFFRYFKKTLGEKFPDKNISFVWQNVSKIGRNDGKPGVTPPIRRLEREHFPVLSEEMRILHPDIVIFLSGPNRDNDIIFHFPDAKFEEIRGETNKSRLCRVIAKDLPSHTYRTYHPSYYKGFNNQLKNLILNQFTSSPREERIP